MYSIHQFIPRKNVDYYVRLWKIRTKLTHHRTFIGIQLVLQLTKENMECHVIPTQQTTGSTKSDSLSNQLEMSSVIKVQ